MKKCVLLVFLVLAPGGYMNQAGAQPSGNETSTFVAGFWGVRYQVKDVARAVAFYTHQLGFKLDQPVSPGIRPGVNRQSESGSQRTGRLRFPSYA